MLPGYRRAYNIKGLVPTKKPTMQQNVREALSMTISSQSEESWFTDAMEQAGKAAMDLFFNASAVTPGYTYTREGQDTVVMRGYDAKDVQAELSIKPVTQDNVLRFEVIALVVTGKSHDAATQAQGSESNVMDATSITSGVLNQMLGYARLKAQSEHSRLRAQPTVAAKAQVNGRKP